jgi:glycosyltransferase involved in cell wall biosynthesis
MKLVIATPLYPPESGGPATYARLLVDHLPTLKTDGGKENSERDEVALVKFSDVRHLPKIIRHVVYFFNVHKAARSADVILALDPVSTGLPAALAAKILKKPFVVKIVGDFAWEQGRQRFGITSDLDTFVREKKVPLAVAFLRTIQKFTARSASRIIVPSHYLEKILIEWGVPSEKISVIYNSIEAPHLTDTNLPKKAKQVVTVARLVPWKGIYELIDAVALVQKNISEVSLLIIGDGPEEMRLKERILSHDEVLLAMHASEVFVLNSSYEGLSHVLIEALHLGNAILASDAGGNTELIQDGINGLVVTVGDMNALVEALQTLLKDENGIQKRLSKGAIESSHLFTVPVMINMTRELLVSTYSSAL